MLHISKPFKTAYEPCYGQHLVVVFLFKNIKISVAKSQKTCTSFPGAKTTAMLVCPHKPLKKSDSYCEAIHTGSFCLHRLWSRYIHRTKSDSFCNWIPASNWLYTSGWIRRSDWLFTAGASAAEIFFFFILNGQKQLPAAPTASGNVPQT